MIGYARLAVVLAALALVLPAAGQSDGTRGSPPLEREIIPGSTLMTSQEREQYRERIRAAGNPEEEQKARDDHYRRVQERARLRGLRLPERQQRAGRDR